MVIENAEIIHEVKAMNDSGEAVALQYCKYERQGKTEFGYRFVRCDKNKNTFCENEQSMFPSLSVVLKLIYEATRFGWSLNNIENDNMKIIYNEEKYPTL